MARDTHTVDTSGFSRKYCRRPLASYFAFHVLRSVLLALETHAIASLPKADAQLGGFVAQENADEREERSQESDASDDDAHASRVSQVAEESHDEVPQEEPRKVCCDQRQVERLKVTQDGSQTHHEGCPHVDEDVWSERKELHAPRVAIHVVEKVPGNRNRRVRRRENQTPQHDCQHAGNEAHPAGNNRRNRRGRIVVHRAGGEEKRAKKKRNRETGSTTEDKPPSTTQRRGEEGIKRKDRSICTRKGTRERGEGKNGNGRAKKAETA